MLIKHVPDASERLSILSQDSRYDLACACATKDDEHRRRSKDHQWIYPVALPQGGTTYLFKSLLSNVCVNNCSYCPLRTGGQAQHCSLTPEEMAVLFLNYYKAGRVQGLFLSSAVSGNPESTMERINRTAFLLRQRQFKGYIHLKVIPGASDAAIRHAVSLASAVSLNIEVPDSQNFRQLCTTKDYDKDIMRSLQLISRLTAKGSCHERVKQTTQFVVGAARETDRQIVNSMGDLYRRLGLSRVYFSAYQKPGFAREDETGGIERSRRLLTREHRLYQTDWLLRKYGFGPDEIPFEKNGNLSLTNDPKEVWAKMHPEFFPVNVNHDKPGKLLRVPGLGQVAVERILQIRQAGHHIRSLEKIARSNAMKKASSYVAF